MPYKTLLVERNTTCPRCNHEQHLGNIMYQDEYRDETICAFCRDEYEDDVEREEGVNGELLK